MILNHDPSLHYTKLTMNDSFSETDMTGVIFHIVPVCLHFVSTEEEKANSKEEIPKAKTMG